MDLCSPADEARPRQVCERLDLHPPLDDYRSVSRIEQDIAVYLRLGRDPDPLPVSLEDAARRGGDDALAAAAVSGVIAETDTLCVLGDELPGELEERLHRGLERLILDEF